MEMMEDVSNISHDNFEQLRLILTDVPNMIPMGQYLVLLDSGEYFLCYGDYKYLL